jgi:hypothetical protein
LFFSTDFTSGTDLSIDFGCLIISLSSRFVLQSKIIAVDTGDEGKQFEQPLILEPILEVEEEEDGTGEALHSQPDHFFAQSEPPPPSTAAASFNPRLSFVPRDASLQQPADVLARARSASPPAPANGGGLLSIEPSAVLPSAEERGVVEVAMMEELKLEAELSLSEAVAAESQLAAKNEVVEAGPDQMIGKSW